MESFEMSGRRAACTTRVVFYMFYLSRLSKLFAAVGPSFLAAKLGIMCLVLTARLGLGCWYESATSAVDTPYIYQLEK